MKDWNHLRIGTENWARQDVRTSLGGKKKATQKPGAVAHQLRTPEVPRKVISAFPAGFSIRISTGFPRNYRVAVSPLPPRLPAAPPEASRRRSPGRRRSGP